MELSQYLAAYELIIFILISQRQGFESCEVWDTRLISDSPPIDIS